MKKSKTWTALFSRGFESPLIGKLLDAKYTLQALQKLDKKDLLNIGLTEDNISSLYDKGRPPIPEPILTQLLNESKFVCCICRNKTAGIVIHHIEEWHISHSHDEKNLVVLCPNHHSEAHTI